MSGASVVPAANRGPTNLNDAPVSAIIDFLRFTVGEAVLFGNGVLAGSERECVMHFLRSMSPGTDWLLDELGGGRRGYSHHFKILTMDSVVCGDVCWGGDRQRGTVSVELTGAGCALIPSEGRPFAAAWGWVRDFMETVQARITRLDIAHDDYSGQHSLSLAEQLYQSGAFDGAFKRPSMQRVGWNDGSGETIYIGKPLSTRQLVVYEKGREQGARDGDPGVEWVRWEARFNNRNRVIPLSILVAPWEYLVGEFPALDWISAVMSVMRTAVARSVSNLRSAIRHCSRQYGGLLDIVTRHVESESVGLWVSRFLARSTTPAWLAANPRGRESISRAFSSPSLSVPVQPVGG